MSTPATPPLDRFPLDVLLLLALHVPLRPRFAVLARVSRRFLQAVRSSVRHYDPRTRHLLWQTQSRNEGAFFSSLPCVESLSVPKAQALNTVLLSPHLSRVRALSLSEFPGDPAALAPIASLTSLTLSGTQCAAAYLYALLHRYAFSLTALSLSTLLTDDDGVPPIALPHLRSLSFEGSQEVLASFDLPALTRLSVSCGGPLMGVLAAQTWPQLQSLGVSIGHQSLVPWVAARASLLTSLDLRSYYGACYTDDVYALIKQATALARLQLEPSMADRDDLCAAVKGLTQLTDLPQLQYFRSNAELQRLVRPRLCRIVIVRTETEEELLSLATQVRKVELVAPAGANAQHWRFPLMHKLSITAYTADYFSHVRAIPALLAAYPTLRRVTVRPMRNKAAESVPLPPDLAQHLEEELFAPLARSGRGVSVVIVGAPRELPKVVAALAAKYPWVSVGCASE